VYVLSAGNSGASRKVQCQHANHPLLHVSVASHAHRCGICWKKFPDRFVPYDLSLSYFLH